ncbi:DUF4884 domain-containing protein [Agrobacterium rubi]|nr:DUF4884 domain-containing protein [Agrobacterium rubi]NTF24955.1 DUF4884 domain-containing protein [Agrobacterium rubi]
MKTIIALALGAVALSGCARDPMETSRTDNPAIVVERLFEHEGCIMYRFMDGGSYVYYSNCQGSTQSRQGKHGKSQVSTTRIDQ